jgi:hypothetical protein
LIGGRLSKRLSPNTCGAFDGLNLHRSKIDKPLRASLDDSLAPQLEYGGAVA